MQTQVISPPAPAVKTPAPKRKFHTLKWKQTLEAGSTLYFENRRCQNVESTNLILKYCTLLGPDAG